MKKRKISDILQSDYNSKRKKKGQEDYFCTFCINLNLHYFNYFQTRNDGYIYISPVKYICEFERGWKYNSSVYRFPLRDEVILELPSLYVYIYIYIVWNQLSIPWILLEICRKIIPSPENSPTRKKNPSSDTQHPNQLGAINTQLLISIH